MIMFFIRILMTAHREKYFNDTLSMIVATIDSDYEKIDMYFAGY